MYQQFNEQFAAATRQYLDTSARINRLALDNAQAVFGLQMAAVGDRANATFAFFGEATEARDFDSLRNLFPRGAQIARENFERAVSTSQEVFGRTLQTQDAIGQLTRTEVESVTRRAGDVAGRAAQQATQQTAQAAQQPQHANDGDFGHQKNANNGNKNAQNK